MKKFIKRLEVLKDLYIYEYYWGKEYRGKFNSDLYMKYLEARGDV